jgi:hypothetical protein
MEREGRNSGRFCGSFCNAGWIAPQDLALHSETGKDLQSDIAPWDNCVVGSSRIQFDRACVRPTQRIAHSREDGPGYPPKPGPSRARGAACGETCGKHEGSPFSPTPASIALSRTSWVPLQAESLRSQALYLVIKRFNFLGESRLPGFRRIGAAQFFQRFLNGEFGCFSHGLKLPRSSVRLTLPIRRGTPVDLDQHKSAAKFCSGPLQRPGGLSCGQVIAGR